MSRLGPSAELEKLRDERMDLRIRISLLEERTPSDKSLPELRRQLAAVERAIKAEDRVSASRIVAEPRHR